MTGQAGAWVRRAGVAVALLSGVAALSMLLLPLVLVLLMVLFENVTQGVLVLLGLLVDWLREFMPGAGGRSPVFQSVMYRPLDVALASLVRSLPCLGGLMLVLLNRAPGGRWWRVVLLWGLAAAIGGQAVEVVLLPGLVVAALFAMPFKALR